MRGGSPRTDWWCAGAGGGGLVAKPCLTLGTPWTVAYPALLSMRFSKQEYWSGLLFPSPGDHPDPGIEPRSPALQADSLPTELRGKPLGLHFSCKDCFGFDFVLEAKTRDLTFPWRCSNGTTKQKKKPYISLGILQPFFLLMPNWSWGTKAASLGSWMPVGGTNCTLWAHPPRLAP